MTRYGDEFQLTKSQIDELSKERPTMFLLVLLERCRMTGFGPSALNFAADIVSMCGGEAKNLSHLSEDSTRIHDVLYKASDALRAAAKE